jgi:protein-tyrosine phosphatase
MSPSGADQTLPYTRRIDVLVVCTGNICRSPMAEALLARGLAERGHSGRVHSAGTRATLGAADETVVGLMADRGYDLGGHRSRQLDRDLVADADLVVCMAREHLRETVLLDPGALARTYTLKELVRRATAAGARGDDEALGDWLARVGEGRDPARLLGDDRRDDVADPIGGRASAYRRAAEEIAGLTADLVRLVGHGSDGAP